MFRYKNTVGEFGAMCLDPLGPTDVASIFFAVRTPQVNVIVIFCRASLFYSYILE